VELYIPYCGTPDFNLLSEFLFKNNLKTNFKKIKENLGTRELVFITDTIADTTITIADTTADTTVTGDDSAGGGGAYAGDDSAGGGGVTGGGAGGGGVTGGGAGGGGV
jgi:hypothetical protein